MQVLRPPPRIRAGFCLATASAVGMEHCQSHTIPFRPVTPGPPLRLNAIALLRWGVAIAVMALMFLWWPYQPWTFAEKVSVLVGWARVLAGDDSGEWIFCPFVPLISFILAWRARAELSAQPLRGHAGGLAVMAFGAFVFWAGYKAGTGYPGFAATQLVLAGLIIWLCGWAWMRVLLFPWLFLVFMWPSFPLESQLAVPMRLMTAGLTSKLLPLIGIAVANEGTAVVSAADSVRGLAEGALFKLDVAAPCSGIRSLYALLMLAALYGYVFLRRWLPRGLLFASALPLAVLGNLVRMVLLAVGSVWWGSEFAIGRHTADGEEVSWYHELAGFAVFAIALGGMFALSSWLEHSRWNRRIKAAAAWSSTSRSETLRSTALRALTAVVFAIAVLSLCHFAGGRPTNTAPGVSLDLPLSIGAAQGADAPMSDHERGALLPEITLSRKIYLGPTTNPTQAAVVLTGPSGRGLHQPEVCTIAQAWLIRDQQTIAIEVAGRQISATMLRVFMDAKDEATGRMVRHRGIHIFWFQGAHGTTAPSYYGHIFRTYWDAVFRNVNHRWALMSFFAFLPDSVPGVDDGLSEVTGLESLKQFISDMGGKILIP